MANASDQDLSAYVQRKAAGRYRRFPPVESPDRADEKDPRFASRRELRASRVPRPRLLKREPSRCPTMIRMLRHEMKPDFRSFM